MQSTKEHPLREVSRVAGSFVANGSRRDKGIFLSCAMTRDPNGPTPPDGEELIFNGMRPKPELLAKTKAGRDAIVIACRTLGVRVLRVGERENQPGLGERMGYKVEVEMPDA